ncbi:hypothetical protein GW17_00026448 [Ensete ventricosum]|nr:hypothetical protein GW17_00026448 [Ensete ventricosum]
MRAELSTIQQTLTPEAASVLTRSIAEAARRSHGQTTPLHVAATLLATPSGLLRQACIRSHPQSSHPLQCRALELCFSVALDRLPAHATPRHNLYINPRLHQHQANGRSGIPAAAAGNAGDQPRPEEVKRVLDILLRPKKRNPILVGDCNLDAVIKEVLQRIQSSDAQPPLRNTQVLPFAKEIATAAPDNSQITIKIRELSSSIEFMIGGESGVILDLGDLKWLVESPSVSTGSGPIQPPVVSEAGRAAVQELGRLLKRFEEGCRVWLVGTATCATYLRCQVYHPTMENDWDLQAVPIAQRSSSLLHMFPRLGGNGGVVTSSVVKPAPVKGLTGMGVTALPLRHQPRTNLCAVCMENYEGELSRLVADEFDKHSTKPEASQALPQWLQLAKLGSGGGAKSPSSPLQVVGGMPQSSKEEELLWKQSTEELLKKWCETCSRLHPRFHQSHVGFGSSSSPPASKPSSVVRPHPPCEPKLTLSRALSPSRLGSNQDAVAPPGSPVKTDLVLGSSKFDDSHKDRLRDFTGCTPDAFSGQQQRAKIAGISDIDTFKRLFQGLAEKVSWQQEAASAIATVVMRCKSGNGKRRNGGSKGDAWLLLLGPDRVGKRKMANALSELVFGTGPTTVSFGRGSDGESNVSCRGSTSMDRIVGAVQRNPFSVVVLEDIDQADVLLQGKVKQAMERGRLPDSYGREVSLGSVIFVLTADWLPEGLKSSYSSRLLQYEEKILDSAYCGWELELSTADKPGKRRPSWACDDDQPTKLRKDSSAGTGLSLDLNLAVGTDAAEAGEGSRNSSDLTTEHEYDKGRLSINCSTVSLALDLVDEAVTFRPVDFGLLRRSILESASVKFAGVMGKGWAIRIDDDALDRIVGGLWLSGASIDDWAEGALVPSLKQLRDNLRADRGVVVLRLSTVKGDRAQQPRRRDGGWLPTTVAIAIDGSHDKEFL